jgi:hypothetical protein
VRRKLKPLPPLRRPPRLLRKPPPKRLLPKRLLNPKPKLILYRYINNLVKFFHSLSNQLVARFEALVAVNEADALTADVFGRALARVHFFSRGFIFIKRKIDLRTEA